MVDKARSVGTAKEAASEPQADVAPTEAAAEATAPTPFDFCLADDIFASDGGWIAALGQLFPPDQGAGLGPDIAPWPEVEVSPPLVPLFDDLPLDGAGGVVAPGEDDLWTSTAMS